MSRPYTAEERAEALTLAERIGRNPAARQLGIGATTLHRWRNPEYAERARKAAILRKRSRVGTCVGCGATTRYTGKGDRGVAERCRSCASRSCASADRRFWTPERIIDAIQDFNDRYGHPPGAQDWSPAMALAKFRDDLAERFYEDGCWPHAPTVQQRFGSWNAAIKAAGFTPLKPGHKYVDQEDE